MKMSISEGRNVLLIFKEAMSNVAKYAGANAVNLGLKLEDEHWEICLENDGKSVSLDDLSGGRGLRNMQSRAAEIGAELELKSNLTRLRCRFTTENEG
ncbi:MAG: hypothetical protein R3B47_18690 [Bacteroidia bacterium]